MSVAPGAGERFSGQQVWSIVRHVGFGVGLGPWRPGVLLGQRFLEVVQTLMEAAANRQKSHMDKTDFAWVENRALLASETRDTPFTTYPVIL